MCSFATSMLPQAQLLKLKLKLEQETYEECATKKELGSLCSMQSLINSWSICLKSVLYNKKN